VAHILRDQKKLLNRLSRLEGQLKALRTTIEGAEKDADCHSVMQQVASMRGALGGLLLVFLEGHVKDHVAKGATEAERLLEADVVLEAIRSFRG
jgi:DNA-binding FrmR family transcriptional regulator